MLRPVSCLALAALLGAFVPEARGGEPEPKELAFPREGFSVVLPPGWAFSQPVSALLEAGLGPNATVWFRRDTGKGDDLAGRLRDLVTRMAGEEPGAKPREPEAWKVKGGGEAFRIEFPQGKEHQHGFALVNQPMGRRLELEWVRRAAAGAPSPVQVVLDSLDVTPYANPQRYVDWKDGWSIDVPGDWKRSREARYPVSFASGDVEKVENPVRLGLRRATQEGKGFEEDGVLLLGESFGVAGESREVPKGATRRLTTELSLGDGRRGFVHTEERAGFWVSIACPDVQTMDMASAVAMVATFRSPPEPGPRAAAADETFARADAPLVVFRSPAAWKKSAPASAMRLSQYEVPGAEPAECVVFFFGAGGGGGVEANLERWKKQFELEGEPKVTKETVAPGFDATVLDASGRYTAETRPGSGVKLDKPGWRMLAAVLTTPQGPLFLKLVGPKVTVEKAQADFLAWLRSFRTKP